MHVCHIRCQICIDIFFKYKASLIWKIKGPRLNIEPIQFLLKKIDSKLIEGYEKDRGILNNLFVK